MLPYEAREAGSAYIGRIVNIKMIIRSLLLYGCN